ncbi:MAG: polysaccharide deacetylase [Chloroflexota bacterium]
MDGEADAHYGLSTLVISLDFELHWGMFDKKSIDEYEEELLGVRQAVPRMLELFKTYGVHTTWATVGLLFFKSRDQLMAALPSVVPQYTNRQLSAYRYIEEEVIGDDEKSDPFHFAPSLINLIETYPYQEIGTHTFSHYYCLEPGQSIEAFQEDLNACTAIATARGQALRSLVFPRNQCSIDYLPVCDSAGILAYRGNQASWLYKAKNELEETIFRRVMRLVNAYIPISAPLSYSWEDLSAQSPIDVPASRFLRSYSKALDVLEPLRLQRIINEIKYAARHNHIYHLWWHPQDFGKDMNQNLSILEEILSTYREMHHTHHMQSLNMGEVANLVLTA